jgi:hypothetical protein
MPWADWFVVPSTVTVRPFTKTLEPGWTCESCIM